MARFYDANNQLMRGDQLFVRCFLEGTGPLKGQYRRIIMQDDGILLVSDANDGTFTGWHEFTYEDVRFWRIYVIAQDVNAAQPNMTPEEVAKIIGRMIRTHQLTINFAPGQCPFVPDGYVHVL